MQDIILLLADDEIIMEEISETFEDEGFNTLAANNGAERWDYLSKEQVEFCLIDLILPNESGLTITKQLREKYNFGIMISTGKYTEIAVIVGL
jgi:DNA-binding response OmpR family regulator